MHRDPADHERRVEAEPVANDLAPVAVSTSCSAVLAGVSAACLLSGQEAAARWLDDHPKWELDKVRCSLGNRRVANSVRDLNADIPPAIVKHLSVMTELNKPV